jgi:hypothetical protein
MAGTATLGGGLIENQRPIADTGPFLVDLLAGVAALSGGWTMRGQESFLGSIRAALVAWACPINPKSVKEEAWSGRCL